MTPTETQLSTDVRHADTVPTKPDRDSVIELICSEAGCTTEDANTFLDWWTDEVVPAMRASSERRYFLPQEALDDPCKHGILDSIAPDDASSTPGGAMAAVEQSTLDIERGELGVLHGKATVYSQKYCQVTTRTVGFDV